ncbi:MAG TPA: hypothetical protein VIE16_06210 [Phenylobacterium sp.]|jgi:hypothetical protein
MKSILAAGAIGAALALAGMTAQAQQTDKKGTVGGAAAGAVTGAAVGGPIGAAVGGVAGATVGHETIDKGHTPAVRHQKKKMRHKAPAATAGT